MSLDSVLPVPMADDFKALQESLACIKESVASRVVLIVCILLELCVLQVKMHWS